MENKYYNYEMEILYIIVNASKASMIMSLAKKFGIRGSTTLLAKGTIKNKLLDFLELNQSNKELIFIIAEKDRLRRFINYLNDIINFSKKRHGIAFTIPLVDVYGLSNSIIQYRDTHEEEKSMYSAIFVIVEKGKGEQVVDASNKAGGRGATIINARGSSSKENQKIFNIEIEPEKEMVLILAEESKIEPICNSIKDNLKIDEPGKGVMFVQQTSKVFGVQ
jgi:nitrogen regulatory protein PII